MPVRFAVEMPMSMLPSTMGPTFHAGTRPMCQTQLVVEIDGKKTPRNFAKATATAAMVPVWITRNRVQPKRNPQMRPRASRK